MRRNNITPIIVTGVVVALITSLVFILTKPSPESEKASRPFFQSTEGKLSIVGIVIIVVVVVAIIAKTSSSKRRR